jgi:hypothetical protein
MMPVLLIYDAFDSMYAMMRSLELGLSDTPQRVAA